MAPVMNIRGLRGQKRHRPRDLLRGGDAPEGALPAYTLSLRAAQQGIGHVGLDEARGDHVEEDAVRRAWAKDWLMAFRPALLAS
jgi:hypothetical protein